jgi:hypothetical protein
MCKNPYLSIAKLFGCSPEQTELCTPALVSLASAQLLYFKLHYHCDLTGCCVRGQAFFFPRSALGICFTLATLRLTLCYHAFRH